MIHTGTQDRLLSETTSGSGVTSAQGSVQSDTLLISVWVSSITSGSLTIQVYTLTEDNQEVLILTVPAITAVTPALVLNSTTLTMQKFRVEATYTGICSYNVYVKATSSGGVTTIKDPTSHVILNALVVKDDSIVHLLGDAVLYIFEAPGTHSQTIKNNSTLEVIG